MDDDRRARARVLFLAVRDLSLSEREKALARACADDPQLRADVEALLTSEAADEPSVTAPSDPLATAATPAAIFSNDPQAGGSGGDGGEASEYVGDQVIGAYEIIREIGRGGFGVVYLARRQGGVKQNVAIKVVIRGKDTEEVLRRFELERQVLSALDHPGIARLYDAGETADGRPYFVMEYIHGDDIEEYCDSHRLTIDERLELFRKVCEAVHYAHQNLIVHRDLKPSNIVVTERGQPKLLDFGIAKLVNPELSLITGAPTAPELRLMTPEYASPEQVRGKTITTVSDVYSLGVLLYELVSGHPPYRLRSRLGEEVVRVICEEEPEKPSTAVTTVEEISQQGGRGPRTTTITPESVGKARESRPERLRKRLSGDVDNIVLKAMRKEPQRRYASAEQMSEDIRRHLGGLPVIARPDTLGYRVSKFVRRNRAGVAATVAMIALLVAGIAATTWQWRVAEAERSAADAARDAEVEQRAVAEEQREVAETRRVQAEEAQARAERLFGAGRGLAHSFVFDFPEELEQIDHGLPLEEMLVKEALKYLDTVSPDAGDDIEFVRELAAAYQKVGDVQGGVRNPSRVETANALESYRKARSLREHVVAGLCEDQTEDCDAAKRELVLNLLRIGDMHRVLDEYKAAARVYHEALVVQGEVKAQSRGDLRRRSAALISLAKVYRQTKDFDSARAYMDQSLTIRRDLCAELTDDFGEEARATALRELSLGLTELGRFHLAQDSPEDAVASFEEAIGIREDLRDFEPKSTRTRRDLAQAYAEWADAASHLDNRPEHTIERLDSARLMITQLVRDNPTDGRMRRTALYISRIYANALQETPDKVIAMFEELLELSGDSPEAEMLRDLIRETKQP